PSLRDPTRTRSDAKKRRLIPVCVADCSPWRIQARGRGGSVSWLDPIGSATAQRQPMDARMADGVLRREGREIGCREAGEPNAELFIYLVRLHPNTTQGRGSLCLDFLERANVRAHAAGRFRDSSPFISSVSRRRSLATHLRSIQSLAGCQRARGRLDDGGIVAFMLLRLRTIVLLVLAS